jgi:hypothetical protein
MEVINELTDSTMIGKIDEDIIIGTTKINNFILILSFLYKSREIYLSKTLLLPIPCIAVLFPSKTLIKFFGVTFYLKIK